MDKFIEEHIINSKFDSLSPEECQAHKTAMVKALMDCIVGKTLVMAKLSKVDTVEVAPIAPIAPIVKKKTRPINPLRHNADGTYNSHCLDPDYAHKYYERAMKDIKATCPCCGTEVLKSNLSKHKKSLKCTHVAMCQVINGKTS